MFSSFSTFNKNILRKARSGPYSSALYYFSLDGNDVNTGRDTTQTLITSDDVLTNGIDKIKENVYAQVGGKTKQALFLDSSINKDRFYLKKRFNLAFNSNARGSISLFVYPISNENYTTHHYIYYSKDGATDNYHRIGFYVFTSSGGNRTFHIYNESTKVLVSPQGDELAFNKWTHIALTWSVNSNQTSATFNLYLNGNLRYSDYRTQEWSLFSNVTGGGLDTDPGDIRRLTQNRDYVTAQTYYTSNFAYWNNKELTPTEITNIISDFT